MNHNVLQRLPPGARVAVIRLRSLGDCVLTTPALALLMQFRPDLQLGVVVEDSFAGVFEANPDVASILPPTVSALARWKPDLALNLHGGSTSSQLTFASRARLRAGFEHFRFRALYNISIPKAQQILGVTRKVHTAEHLASAVFFLGVPVQEIPRAVLFPSQKPKSARRSYAVIHPIASAPDKTWPAGSFVAAAKFLKRELSLKPIFIAGPGESLTEFDQFDCVVCASLDETKNLLAGASLFLGNDSGPAHMAAAFGLPTVVLFGASDPAIWGPWRTESQTLTAPEGINGIQVDQVTAALTSLHAGQTR
jgi:heptosyltransferase-3